MIVYVNKVELFNSTKNLNEWLEENVGYDILSIQFQITDNGYKYMVWYNMGIEK